MKKKKLKRKQAFYGFYNKISMCQELNRFTLDNEDSTTEVHNMDILGNLKKHNMDADHKDMENCANAAKAWVLKKLMSR